MGDSQKKLENIELQIDTKIKLYSVKPQSSKQHKFIVGMLKQIKSKDE